MNPETASIEDLELPPRAWNALKNARCKTVADVIRMTPRELLRMPNFGKKSLQEVCEALSDVDLTLASESNPWNAPQEIQWMKRINDRLAVIEKHLGEMRSALIEVLEYDLKSGHLRITKKDHD